MRMKTIKAASAAVRLMQRLLEVRLPTDALYGLRTRNGNGSNDRTSG